MCFDSSFMNEEMKCAATEPVLVSWKGGVREKLRVCGRKVANKQVKVTGCYSSS